MTRRRPGRISSSLTEVFDHGLKKTALMNMLARQLNRDLTLDVLEQWGNQIAAGKTPDSAPPRPQGIERNFVITQWQYGERYTYAHDIISTDKRNPSLYPEAKIYGLDIGNDHLLIMDPKALSRVWRPCIRVPIAMR